MSKRWSVGARSETGYVRNENQDRMSYVQAPLGDIYIVSDGMGGHRGGALAAELTVETLNQSLLRLDSISMIDPSAIKGAFEEANAVVYERGHAGDANTEGMGATAVVLLVTHCQVMVAHVGDSRAYLFTGENKLERLTKDHSRVQRMIDAGILTAAEASVHPDASVLERAIGTSPTVKVDISSWIPLREGDQILLCSDGLHGYVSDAEIADILSNPGTPQELADQLVNLALEKGGEDNITIQLIECEGGDEGGVSRIMGRLAIVVPGIMILSAATAFVTTEYRPAALKIQLEAMERKNDLRDAELLQRADKVDQSLESLRAQIAQLNEKVDRFGKAPLTPPSAHQHSRAGEPPKSKKGRALLPSEKHGFATSRATEKNIILSNTSDQSGAHAAEIHVTSEINDNKAHQPGNSDATATALKKLSDKALVKAGDRTYFQYKPISDPAGRTPQIAEFMPMNTEGEYR